MYRYCYRPPLWKPSKFEIPAKNCTDRSKRLSFTTPPLPKPSKAERPIRIPTDALELFALLDSGRVRLTDEGCAAVFLHAQLAPSHGFLSISWLYSVLRERHDFQADALAAATLVYFQRLREMQRACPDRASFTPESSTKLLRTNAEVVDYQRAQGAIKAFSYYPVSLAGPLAGTASTLQQVRDLLETVVASVSHGLPEVEEMSVGAAVLWLSADCLQLHAATPYFGHNERISLKNADAERAKCLQVLFASANPRSNRLLSRIWPLLVQFGDITLVERLIDGFLPLAPSTDLTGEIFTALCDNVYFNSTVITKTLSHLFSRYHSCIVRLLETRWPSFHEKLTQSLSARNGDDFIKKYVRNYRSGLLKDIYDALPSLYAAKDAFPRAFYVSLLQGPCRDLRYRCISGLKGITASDFEHCWQNTTETAHMLLERDPGILKILFAQGQEVFATARQFQRTSMFREFHVYKHSLWKAFALQLMRGHRRHFYNILSNLSTTAAFFTEVLLALLRFCSVDFARDFAQAYRAKHPSRITLTPRLLRLLSHPSFRIVAPQRFWWRCNCLRWSGHLADIPESALADSSSDPKAVQQSLGFLRDEFAASAPTEAFQHVIRSIDAAGRFDAAVNPGRSTSCSNCGGYSCACGRTYPSAVSIENCASCDAPPAWRVAAAKVDIWYCSACEAPVRGAICPRCQSHDAQQFWSCSSCQQYNPNASDGPMACVHCGQLHEREKFENAALVACQWCATFHFASQRCKQLQSGGVDANSEISYFTWACGCGATNSPMRLNCGKCGKKHFTCRFCEEKQVLGAHDNKAQWAAPPNSALQSVTKAHCISCRMPHPRTWALFAGKTWRCMPCGQYHSIHSQHELCTQSVPMLTNGEVGSMDTSAWWKIHRASAGLSGRFFPSTYPKYLLPFSMRREAQMRSARQKQSHPFVSEFWLCTVCTLANPSYTQVCGFCTRSRDDGALSLWLKPWRNSEAVAMEIGTATDGHWLSENIGDLCVSLEIDTAQFEGMCAVLG